MAQININNLQEQLMGSKPSKDVQIQAADSYFKNQVKLMKFSNNKAKFGQNSKQASKAIMVALQSLKKNNILNNSEFMKLQGKGQIYLPKINKRKYKSQRNVRKAQVIDTIDNMVSQKSQIMDNRVIKTNTNKRLPIKTTKLQVIKDKGLTIIQL